MKRKFIKSLMFSALVWATQASAVTVLSPDNGDIVTSKPVLKFQSEKGEKLGKNTFVFINGRDVTQDAVESSMVDDRFKVKKGVVGKHLRRGENNIVFITTTDEYPKGHVSSTTRFHFDKGGPSISVAQVKKLSDSKMRIKILADDPVGTSSVWVNGRVADKVRDGVFSVTVKKKKQYKIIAEDVSGNTETVLYSGESGRLKNSIGVTISNDNLGPIADLTEEIMVQNNIADYIQNPIYNGSPDSKLIKNVNFNIVSANYSRPDVVLHSSEDKLEMTANISDMVLDVEGTSTACFILCITLPVYGTIEVDSARINADVLMSAADGNIDVALNNFSTALGDYYFHSNWEWFHLVQSIINNITAQILPSSFQLATQSPIESILRREFNNLDTQLYAHVFGKEATVSAILQDIKPLSGGLEIRAEANFDIQGKGGKAGLGFRIKNAVAPSLNANGVMSAAVTVDLANQMIWEGQKAGLFELRQCGDSSSIPAISIAGVDFNQEIGTGYFDVSISSKDPAYIEVSDAIDSLVTLNVPDLPLSIRLFNGDGVGVVDASLRVSVQGDADLIVNNNAIGIDVIGLPIVNVDFTSVKIQFKDDWQYGASREEKDQLSDIVSHIVLALMPNFIELVERSVGLIKVPTLAGFSIIPERFNTNVNAIGMEGVLVKSYDDNYFRVALPREVVEANRYCKKIDRF